LKSAPGITRKRIPAAKQGYFQETILKIKGINTGFYDLADRFS